MTSSNDDPSPPEGDRAANRRWMIGLLLTLAFGIFGAVMAVLSYMDRGTTTIYRNRKSPPAAQAGTSGGSPPAATPAPSGDPAPAAPAPSADEPKGDEGKGNGKGDDKK
jgi:predicted outer membrane lipoprotein